MDSIEIPERLKKFPLYKGMLVHFTVFVGDDGIPDFKVVHENHRRECMEKSLCAICGETLTTPMVFIGGEGTIERGLFIDGPMDEACALYATKVCPYLRLETWEHTPRPPRHLGQKDAVFTEFSSVPIGRPRMGMYYTDGYRIVRTGYDLIYLASPPFYVRWDTMPQPGGK
jgi:hypothetical protein